MDNTEQRLEAETENQPQKLEQIQLAVDFFEQIFNGIQDIVLLINPQDYKILTFNQSALDGLELSEAELLGANCYKLFYGQAAPCQIPFHTCPIKQVLKTKKHMLAEYQYTTPSKQVKHFEASVNLIPDKRDNQYQIAYVLRDITAKKKKDAGDTASIYRDQSTNLHNEAFFKYQLGIELSRVKRYDRPLSLVVLGVDNLAAFDALSLVDKSNFLSMIGQVINNNTRSMDSGYNCGGNRFHLVLPETDETSALIFAGRLKQVFKSKILKVPLQKTNIFSYWTISMGVVGFLPVDTVETLTTKALSALQKAQTEGGDRIYVYHLEGNL